MVSWWALLLPHTWDRPPNGLCSQFHLPAPACPEVGRAEAQDSADEEWGLLGTHLAPEASVLPVLLGTRRLVEEGLEAPGSVHSRAPLHSPRSAQEEAVTVWRSAPAGGGLGEVSSTVRHGTAACSGAVRRGLWREGAPHSPYCWPLSPPALPA